MKKTSTVTYRHFFGSVQDILATLINQLLVRFLLCHSTTVLMEQYIINYY